MLEFYDRMEKPLDREASISIEMLRYFVPLLQERGYDELSSRIKNDFDRLFGPTGSIRHFRR